MMPDQRMPPIDPDVRQITLCLKIVDPLLHHALGGSIAIASKICAGPLKTVQVVGAAGALPAFPKGGIVPAFSRNTLSC